MNNILSMEYGIRIWREKLFYFFSKVFDSTEPNPGRVSVSPFIRSLTEAVIPLDSIQVADPERERVASIAADFVQGQLESLPAHVRIVFSLGMLAFRLFVRARYLSNFCRLPLDKRSAIVSDWAYGRVAVVRQLFRVVRSSALLAFYEIPDVRAALDTSSLSEKPTPPEKQ